MTGVLVERSLRRHQRQGNREAFRERRGILYGELIVNRVTCGPSVPFDDVQVPPGTATAVVRVEHDEVVIIRDIHDERVAFPAPARVAHPLPHSVGEVRATVERNHADFVDHLLENRHILRRLKNVNVVVVATWQLGRAPRQAALGEVSILGPPSEVARGLRHSNCTLLPFWRQGRNPSIGRIDDERRAACWQGLAAFPPELVVGAVHVRCRVSRRALIGADRLGLVERARFTLGQKFSSSQRTGPFKWCDRGVRPHPLQVGIAPCCAVARCRALPFHVHPAHPEDRDDGDNRADKTASHWLPALTRSASTQPTT